MTLLVLRRAISDARLRSPPEKGARELQDGRRRGRGHGRAHPDGDGNGVSDLVRG